MNAVAKPVPFTTEELAHHIKVSFPAGSQVRGTLGLVAEAFGVEPSRVEGPSGGPFLHLSGFSYYIAK